MAAEAAEGDGSPAERSRTVACRVPGVAIKWSEAHGSHRKEKHDQEGEEISVGGVNS